MKHDKNLYLNYKQYKKRIRKYIYSNSDSKTGFIDLVSNLNGDQELNSQAIHDLWSIAFLRGEKEPKYPIPKRSITIVDLFCGAGGFALGAKIAANTLGYDTQQLAGFDVDTLATQIHKRNFKTDIIINKNASHFIDYQIDHSNEKPKFTYQPELIDIPKLANRKVDLLIGGPPCQGHSNQNNHTRRDDPRNGLYLLMPAYAAALDAKVCIVENVITVLKDKQNTTNIALNLFEDAGYNVQQLILDASEFGVPQKRKRHFMIASKNKRTPEFSLIFNSLKAPVVPVKSAISDLEDIKTPSSEFDLPSILSSENIKRINYLFDNDIHDLPNSERPLCHKEQHSYPSIYGKLYNDQSAFTLTTGFLSPGRGRFIHPTRRRGLTPHEGARLQGFPDFFDWKNKRGEQLTRTQYSKLIGDAVPPLLGFIPCLLGLMYGLKEED